MVSVETIITFSVAAVMLGLAPGPDNLFVLTQSMLYGVTSGIFVTLGLCTGLIFHTLAVALGIAVIFQTSAVAFSCLKFFGAGYLLYLAWKAWTSPKNKLADKETKRINYRKLYQRGVIMNVTNPKVSIFFLAFLPQFVNNEAGFIPLQIGILGTIFIVSTIFVFGSIAFLSGRLGEWLNKSPKIQTILNRISAFVFLGIAARIAFAQR